MNKISVDLQIKSLDETEGVFVGIASTPTPDRANDVVEPKGAVFSLPLPLLAFHDQSKPIGTVERAVVTHDGIEVVCRVLKDATQQAREVWNLIQAGAMKGLSIGFKPLNQPELLKGGGYRFTKFEWLELSVVPVAMNGQAAITATKSATPNTQQKGIKEMSISAQIQQFKAKKAEVLATMDALIAKGTTLAGDDETAYKAAEGEVTSIEAHITRLEAAEQRQKSAAKPIGSSIVVNHALGLPAGDDMSIRLIDNPQTKGLEFARFAKAVALGQGNPYAAMEVAKAHRMSDVVKSAISSMATSSNGDTGIVPNPQAFLASEFISLLRPMTLIGRMNMRAVPMNARIPKQVQHGYAYWVGEGAPIPVGQPGFGDLWIGRNKIASITPFTREMLERAEPSVDVLVRDDLLKTMAQALDSAFVDPTNAGTVNLKPASITNGLTPIAYVATTGETRAQNIRDLIAKLYNAFLAVNQPMDSAVLIMHPTLAVSLQLLRSAMGVQEFPGLHIDTGDGAGVLEGLPVITSTQCAGDATNGYDIILVNQGDIFLGQENGIVLDASREASLLMDTDPANATSTPVSMWQNDMIALRALREITWVPRRPTAVAVATGVPIQG